MSRTPFRFSKRSFNNLDRVDPRLVVVAGGGILLSRVDFVVFDGARDIAEQIINVDKGVSWTLDSDHVIDFDKPEDYATAIDCVPYVDGSLKWENDKGEPLVKEFQEIARALKLIARHHRVNLGWGANRIYGGDWKNKNDMAHFYIKG